MTKRKYEWPELENGNKSKKPKTQDKDNENLAIATPQTLKGDSVEDEIEVDSERSRGRRNRRRKSISFDGKELAELNRSSSPAKEVETIAANKRSRRRKKGKEKQQDSTSVNSKGVAELSQGLLPADEVELNAAKKRSRRRKKKAKELGTKSVDTQGPAEPLPAINDEVETSPAKNFADKPSPTLAQQERRVERKEQETGSDALQKPDVKTLRTVDGKVLKRKYSKEVKKSQGNSNNCSWLLSEVIGGQMLGLDPVFSLNEEYLLIPYDTAIHVYATSTSLLVRRLRIFGPKRVSAFAMSSTNPNNLFVSTDSGSIERWDWIEGRRLEYWNISASIYSLANSNPHTEESTNGLVYTVDRKGQGPWMLTVHRLFGGSDASKTDLGTLLKYSEPLTSIKILDGGRIILATSGQRLIIGFCDRPNPGTLKDVSYVWRDLDCPEWITSIDVRMRSYEAVAKKLHTPKSSLHSAVDVAVGTLKGKIIIYDNLLGNLIRTERGANAAQADGLSSRFLHWHRTAVLSLKWSADGNYIISGGFETVLVLWQLETGQKQVLPHLSAPIESIVVSPSGSSYGIRLADNSAMILSTSQLQPTFSIAGIQLPANRTSGTPLPFVPAVHAPSQNSRLKNILSFPAVVSPSNPGHLLLAVPSFTTSGLIPKSYNPCYLQTFDINSAHQFSKQALTRTKDTIVNIGPELNVIEEPSVIHLQISYDGRWLATIDEWIPPRLDLAMLAFDKEGEVEEQLCRREICMKIWQWDDQLKTWELSSRIDNPHSTNMSTVLHMASDPSCASFATIGDDYILRIWKPSARHRNGREVFGSDGKRLMTWCCRSVTPLEGSSLVGKENHQGAKLSYSPDGSILAAGYSLSSSPTIYLIEVSTGTVTRTLSNLYTGPLIGLGILDKFLIILSNELRVWDLVTEEDSFAFHLKSYRLMVQKQLTATQLATNCRQRTFAISLPEIPKISNADTKLESRILVFDPNKPTPVFQTTVHKPTTILLPAEGRNGYYLVDDTAQIRVLSFISSMPMHVNQPPVERTASWGFEDIFGTANNADPKTNPSSKSKETSKADGPQGRILALSKEDSVVVVSQEKLAELFDTGSAFTLPPITELFWQVASLYSRKPAT